MTSIQIIEGQILGEDEHYHVVQDSDGNTYKIPLGADVDECFQLEPNKYLKIKDILSDNNNEEDIDLDINPKEQTEWDDCSTKLLINLYKEKRELVDIRKIRTLKKMWGIIADEMNAFNYRYTSSQCENRWKTLERGFKNKIKNNGKTGRGRQSCAYKREISNILCKRNNIIPPSVLDSTTGKTKKDVIVQSNILLEDNQLSRETEPRLNTLVSDDSSVPSTSGGSSGDLNNNCKRKRKGEIDQLVQAIEKRTALKQENQELKQKLGEEMLHEMKRRNDLLEQLVSSSKNLKNSLLIINLFQFLFTYISLHILFLNIVAFSSSLCTPSATGGCSSKFSFPSNPKSLLSAKLCNVQHALMKWLIRACPFNFI